MVTDSGAASEEAAVSLDAATEDATELAVEEEAPQAARTPAALTAAIAVKNERREIFFIRIYLCMIILACVNKACFIFLQAMGKAVESTALSMVREVVFGVGFALLLPRFFGLDGVLYSMPMSDILTFLIAGYLICKTYRELSTKGEV